MASIPAWLDKAGEKLFNGGASVKQSIETRFQDLREVAEDLRDDPRAKRDRLISDSQQKVKELGSLITDEFKDAQKDPLKYAHQILSFSPFSASQSASTSLELPPDEYTIIHHGAGDLPPQYAEYLGRQEKPCPICLELSKNTRVPLAKLRKHAESGLCWNAPLALTKLEFYTSEERPQGLWPPFLQRKHVARDPTSNQCFYDIQQWVAECASEHLFCRESLSRRPMLPTRVVEIDPSSDPPSLKLVETNNVKGVYVALSHCWGNIVPLKTTRACYDAHRGNIPFAQLSRTFQNSVTIAAKLGIKSLWIDSLCIIQDDATDWTTESSRMGTIYEKAHIVIAASAAADGSQGFLQGRMGFHEIETITSKDHSGVQAPQSVFTRHFTPEHRWYEQRWQNPFYKSDLPLLGRAWAFQERLLATRVLHYTPFEMIWECKTRVMCECEQIHERNPGGLKHKYALSLRFGHAFLLDREDVWGKMVEEYSSRNLTYPTDRLVALSATAKRIAHPALGKYLAGLWRRNLTDRLLWWRRSSTYPSPRSTSYVAPTWSWASVEGQILDNPERLEPRDLPMWITRYRQFLSEAHCEIAGDDPYGRVTGGHLILSALTFEATLHTPAPQEHYIQRQMEAPTDAYKTELQTDLSKSQLHFTYPHSMQSTLRESTLPSAKHTLEPNQKLLFSMPGRIQDIAQKGATIYALGLRPEAGTVKLDFMPDIDIASAPDHLPDGTKLLCVLFQAKKSERSYALVLKHSTRETGSYERIGIVELEKDWLGGFKWKRDIKIV